MIEKKTTEQIMETPYHLQEGKEWVSVESLLELLDKHEVLTNCVAKDRLLKELRGEERSD